MMMFMLIVIMVIVIMIMQLFVFVLRCTSLLQFLLKQLPDRRVLLVFFDLLDVERNSQPFREVAFGDRKVSSSRLTGIEMLVIPEKGGRHDRACLPIHLYRFGVLQSTLSSQ